MPKYIDADALLKKFNIDDMETVNGCVPIRIARETIERAPTADVAEVVHGKWILLGKNEHNYETSVEEKCSLCGRYVYRYDTELQDNYCPNCGAKMDKEDET